MPDRYRASMEYYWPNEDPEYFQQLVEYIIEADNERNIPATWFEFTEDFELWCGAQGVQLALPEVELPEVPSGGPNE